MGGFVSPPCCLTWDKTMVEVMKIMVTSFKRSYACTAALSAPDPVAGHCRPMPLPGTLGHSRANLGQSLVGSLLLSLGSWSAQGLFVPSKSLFPQLLYNVCNQIPLASKVKFPEGSQSLCQIPRLSNLLSPSTFLTVWEFIWYDCSAACGLSAQWLYGGVTFSKRAYATPRTAAPRAPAPAAGNYWAILP